MILTIGAHPSLEKTITLPNFRPDQAHRIGEHVITAGSKGFNFARALRTMGHTTTVVTPLAGHTGQRVYSLAAAEGLECAAVWVPGETRMVINLAHPDTGGCTELIENGPQLAPENWPALEACILERLPQAHWLVVCGSFLPGTPEQALHQIVKATHQAGVQVVLDTYGPPLLHALPAGPALLKINQKEASDLLEREICTPDETRQAAVEIRERGPRAVVITMGAAGAAGVDAHGQTFGWAAPGITCLCAVGSGDSMLAGLMARWVQGQTLAEAARWGVAAGTANALGLGPGKFEPAQVEYLVEQVTPL
jgi:1-phosphofructokinase family hexose kinase